MLIQVNRSLKEKIKGLEARLEARPAPMAAISKGAMAASLAAHFDDRFAVLRALAEGDYVLDPVTGKQMGRLRKKMTRTDIRKWQAHVRAIEEHLIEHTSRVKTLMGGLKNTLNRLSLENRDLKQECEALKAAAVAATSHVPMASLEVSCDRFSRHIAVERIRSLAKADVEAINGDVATGVGWFIVSAVVATIILWLSGAPIMAYIIPLSNLGLAWQIMQICSDFKLKVAG